MQRAIRGESLLRIVALVQTHDEMSGSRHLLTTTPDRGLVDGSLADLGLVLADSAGALLDDGHGRSLRPRGWGSAHESWLLSTMLRIVALVRLNLGSVATIVLLDYKVKQVVSNCFPCVGCREGQIGPRRVFRSRRM